MDNTKLSEIVLELLQPRKLIFPQNTLNVLSRYFPNDAIVFLTGPTFELYTENTHFLESKYSHYFFQPTFAVNQTHAEKMPEYWQFYAHDDPFQIPNLPLDKKDSVILRWTDLDMKTPGYRNIQEHWRSYGSPHGINIYLQVNKICLGSLCFIRKREFGDFTDEEYELLRQLSLYIAPMYHSYIQESFYAGINTILKDYYHPDFVGFSIVTMDANPIMKNDVIDEYCEEILDFYQDQYYRQKIISSNDTLIGRVIRMLTQSHEPITSEVTRLVVTDNMRYKCTIRPCMMTGLSADIHMLFILKIVATPLEESNSISSVAKEYDLTNREIEILQLLLSDYRNSAIMGKLMISESTVKTHIRNIYRKLGVNHRVELYNLFHK